MSFHNSVSALIDKYGSKVKVVRGDSTVSTKAFIQPLRYRTNVYSDLNVRLGGFTDGRYYLYIGKSNCEFYRADNAIIICNDGKYTVHTSEKIQLNNKTLYIWAVLIPYKEQRRDDYEDDRA